jgi:hypothetical protein
VRIVLWLSLLSVLLAACGPKLPPRYVLEKDLGSYKFRRYQQVLDVEIPIDGNEAVGHTATYVRGGQTIRVAPVFVTAYQKGAGLTESVRQSLRSMQAYTFDITKQSGAYVYRMRGEGGDNWLLWVSGKHVVKLGAPEGEKDVPEELLESYLDQYPSDLDENGKAKNGAQSAGPAASRGEPAAASNAEAPAPAPAATP